MGLAYLFLFLMAGGAAGAAAACLKTAWPLWKKPRSRVLAVLLFLLAGLCAAAALYFLGILWREPPWGFHF